MERDQVSGSTDPVSYTISAAAPRMTRTTVIVGPRHSHHAAIADTAKASAAAVPSFHE